ncbi:MAG: ABC transporter substrate-binding protein, partial [Candidatus Nanopelagicaceae bacterium]
IATAAAAGLAVSTLSPANAATRSTVVLVTSNQLTGLNPSVTNMNLTFNSEVAYMQGFGFNYYDNSPKLVDNKIFGSYKIVSQKPFKVQYTVNKGKVWSDGTPITGVDLLLSHVVCSSSYSFTAKLGDPTDNEVAPAFNALCYGGVYDQAHVGLPTLSSDKMSVTVEYDSKIPDWQIYGPGPSAVHALVHLAEGKTGLQNAAANLAAKAKFEKAFYDYNTKLMKAAGEVWSKSYNINKVDSSTNPLLLVGNGAYILKTAVPGQAVTLGLNPKHVTNPSGPKTSGVKSVVFRIIGDGTAAAQALRNQEVDIYQGQPTADSVKLLSEIPTAKIIGGAQAVYEHIDLRVGTANGVSEEYTGPFAGDSQKAKDLRTAFLMAYPRDEIVDKLIKPINSSAVRMDSLLLFPGEPGYNDMVKNNGVSKYTKGTQAQREAEALALVRKYSATDVKVNLLWGTPSNARRAASAQIVKAALGRAGFDVNAPGVVAWSSQLDSSAWDAEFFAWVKSAITQEGNADLFYSDGGNNLLGYRNKTVDAAVEKLRKTLLPEKDKLAQYTIIEKQIMSDALTLPIFQHPGVTAVNKKLQNVKPNPLSPQLVWNYWEWKYSK